MRRFPLPTKPSFITRFLYRYKNLSLVKTFSFWLAITFLILSSIFGKYTFDLLEENKLQDELTIQFLEMERLGNNWITDLKSEKNFKKSKINIPKDIKEFFDTNHTGIFIDWKDGISKVYKKNKNTIFERELNSYKFFKSEKESKNQSLLTVYIVNQEGKLIYSNLDEITALNIADREIVQYFIRNPITSGMSEYFNNDEQSVIGFYQQIPNSNLVLFTEASKTYILDTIFELKKKVGMIWLGIMLLGLVLIQFPLRSAQTTLKELITNAKKAAKGDFKFHIKKSSFGELGELSQTFKNLGRDLIERDKNIQNLMLENQEKVRLEGELALTQSIQNAFLPVSNSLEQSGIKISSSFIPANEAAGDWFNYFFHEPSGQTIVAIADVSGHGSGSAMFTAVIGGLFDDFKNQYSSDSDVEIFIERLGGVIHRLGKGNWHATFLLAKFESDNSKVHFKGAGHCFPMIFNVEALKPNAFGKIAKPRLITLPSEPLGMSPKATIKSKSIDLPRGSQLLFYTDGLIEAKDAKGKLYGQKKLRNTILNKKPKNVFELTSQVKRSWVEHIKNSQVDDDTCIVGIEVA